MGSSVSINPLNLTDADIELLKKKTQFSRDEIINWHTRFMKDNPDGLLNLEKFIEMFRIVYPFGSSEKHAKIAFKIFDVNQTGTMKFDEFILATAFAKNKRSDSSFDETLDFSFKIFDTNGDGKVSIEEVQRVIVAIYEVEGYDLERVKSKVDAIFTKFDLDHNKWLDKEEFRRFIVSDPVISRILL